MLRETSETRRDPINGPSVSNPFSSTLIGTLVSRVDTEDAVAFLRSWTSRDYRVRRVSGAYPLGGDISWSSFR